MGDMGGMRPREVASSARRSALSCGQWPTPSSSTLGSKAVPMVPKSTRSETVGGRTA